MISFTEENYLKALLKLTIDKNSSEAGTNEIAALLGVKPATANDMLKKLKEKNLVQYEKYGKISLTKEGRKRGMEVIRKHRLWETFLHTKLGFSWDEVHEVAEQLEHIQSQKLVDKLDEFLNYPEFDPHGDPIPTSKGVIKVKYKKRLLDMEAGQVCRMLAVKENSASFLHYVEEIGLRLNEKIKVKSKNSFDEMMEIEVRSRKKTVSKKFAENIFVE